MNDIIDSADCRQEMVEARAYTHSLLVNLEAEDFCRQVHPEFSPIGWHLGHIGVTESFWILQQCKGEAPLVPAYDTLFSPLDTPKQNRINLPSQQEILVYLDAVREQVFTFLEQGGWEETHPLLFEGRIFNMLLQHEEQHNETMLMILNLLAAARSDADVSSCPVQPSPTCTVRRPTHSRRTRFQRTSAQTEMVCIPGGPFGVGSDHAAGTLDNERPRQTVQVGEFLIDRTPVTNADFMQFIERGGYANPAWWSQDGWSWRTEHHVRHPLHWRSRGHTSDGGNGWEHWMEIRLARTGLLDPTLPAMCISWYEADAYARSVGKRLPTEAEWEKAASWASNNRVEGAGPSDCLDILGSVWEWTNTWFHPYPGFQASPYEGYSVPYFDQQHRVLKGGSWVTRRHVARTTFRNWYHPGMRTMFAGLRCAKDSTSRAAHAVSSCTLS